ncbi:hypothetical protein T310_5451 [Rasamsonia emersonii CBS 393.64]|uniref:Uncharacterized protein n=1 Tax=Rasamsonia emersonii (strain ATCC 16479 / CBS 393.64 / IMI 116815) TaxID=1408163 RepID=A0A0F4YQE7_RASE3|nr:hypothetical protein T310_5451 [Rasamsonia emersonii CBS 393.64]KKA20507.1 hypothetical protein T310_5451 [Rasamsonia emersonii CBS 393.64]
MEDLQEPPFLWEMKIYCCACGTLIELDTETEGSTSILGALRKEFPAPPPKLVKDYQNGHEGQCQCRLSGIGQLDEAIETSSFAVPRDRNAAVLGWPWKQPRKGAIESVFLAEDLQMTSYYQGPWPRRPERYGYPVHARCWSLIERFIGPDVEMHLATFVEALRRRFRKRINPPNFDVPDGNFDLYPTRYETLSSKTRYLFRDPVQIPQVGRLLKNAVITKKTRQLPLQDRDGEREERITKQYDIRQSSRRLLALGRSPFGAVDLPLDIQYLILD